MVVGVCGMHRWNEWDRTPSIEAMRDEPHIRDVLHGSARTLVLLGCGLLAVLAHGQYLGGQGRGTVQSGCEPSDCLDVPGGSAMPGTSCDDGDACTIADVYMASCQCAGTPSPDSDGDLICDILDICPNDPFNDQDADGICGDVDNCPTVPGLIGDTCNDGNCFTLEDVITPDCVCTGTGTGEEGSILGNTILADGLSYWFSTTDVVGAQYTWSILPNAVGWQLNAQGAVASVVAPSSNAEVELCVSATLNDTICVVQACTPLFVMDVGSMPMPTLVHGITIRPNPSDGRFELRRSTQMSGPVLFEVLDAMGRSVIPTTVMSSTGTLIDLGPASPGVYLVKIRDSEGAHVLRAAKSR